MREQENGGEQSPPIMIRIYKTMRNETVDQAFNNYLRLIPLFDDRTNVYRVFEIADYIKKDKLQMHRDVFLDRPNVLVGAGAIYCKS